MTTFVDTNVLLDIVGADPVWLGWSDLALEAASRRGAVRIGRRSTRLLKLTRAIALKAAPANASCRTS